MKSALARLLGQLLRDYARQGNEFTVAAWAVWRRLGRRRYVSGPRPKARGRWADVVASGHCFQQLCSAIRHVLREMARVSPKLRVETRAVLAALAK